MSEEIKFALTSGLEPLRGLTLEANFSEVQAQLQNLMAPYEKLVVNPDDMADAKNILARIRKVKTSIDEYRKSVKREYSAPLTAFENRVKELLASCSEAESNLSEQLNKYDAQRRKAKMDKLEQFFTDNVGDMAPFLRFDQIRNDKWGNSTVPIENGQSEIKQAIDMCADGVNAIRSLNSEFEAALLNAYAKNHDLAGAMKLNGELTEQKRREAERRAALDAAKTTAEREEVKTVQRIAEAQKPQEKPTVDADRVYDMTLRFSGTKEQLVALRSAIDLIGIRFVKVE